MQRKHQLITAVVLLALLAAGCTPKTSQPADDPVAAIVAATVAAIPTHTPYPTPTPIVLSGLFCEYGFCVGHPTDVALYDVSAARDQLNPSTYGQGMLAAYRKDLFMLIVWQLNSGSTDPQFMLDLVMDDDLDSRSGSLDVDLLGDLTIFSVPITTAATPVLPFGRAAAWNCGERAFGWKVYTPQTDMAPGLLRESLERFTCGE